MKKLFVLLMVICTISFSYADNVEHVEYHIVNLAEEDLPYFMFMLDNINEIIDKLDEALKDIVSRHSGNYTQYDAFIHLIQIAEVNDRILDNYPDNSKYIKLYNDYINSLGTDIHLWNSSIISNEEEMLLRVIRYRMECEYFIARMIDFLQ